MKNILLATDLGVHSDRAMERALKIAKEQKAQLHIVHIAPDYTGAQSKKNPLNLLKKTEDLILTYLGEYKDFEDVDTKITVKQGGEVFFEILEVAYAHKADLIVAGMHGKNRFRDLFIGTTIERIIRKGITPVLLVKDKPSGSYQSVLAGVDFAQGSRNAMRLAMGIAPEAVFHAVHMFSLPVTYFEADFYIEVQAATEKSQRKMMDAFVNTERSYFEKKYASLAEKISGEVIEGAVIGALIEKAKGHKADLLTMGTHSQVGFRSKLGGTAGGILSDPPCDVLVASEKFHDEF